MAELGYLSACDVGERDDQGDEHDGREREVEDRRHPWLAVQLCAGLAAYRAPTLDDAAGAVGADQVISPHLSRPLSWPLAFLVETTRTRVRRPVRYSSPSAAYTPMVPPVHPIRVLSAPTVSSGAPCRRPGRTQPLDCNP